MTDTYILILGDPISGFSFVGPFPNAAAAEQFGEREYSSTSWWIEKLDLPFSTNPEESP